MTILHQPREPGGAADTGTQPADIVAAHTRPRTPLLGYLRTTSHKDIA
ncbi:hypothetical protein AAY23_106061, partial [Frankia casuarinae]